MKWLGGVSQNEYFQSRVFGDFLRIMIGYFMSIIRVGTLCVAKDENFKNHVSWLIGFDSAGPHVGGVTRGIASRRLAVFQLR